MANGTEHSPIATDEFTGFANAPVDKDGKRLDFRDVDAYADETDEGKVRSSSQTTESSVVALKSEGPSTNGYPAAKVGGNGGDVEQEGTSDEEEADTDPDATAEGEGANEDS